MKSRTHDRGFLLPCVPGSGRSKHRFARPSSNPTVQKFSRRNLGHFQFKSQVKCQRKSPDIRKSRGRIAVTALHQLRITTYRSQQF
jgi:hypothetical protein